jgi:hypothetical protein
MPKRKGFWGKFDDLMDSLPGYIDDQMKDAKKEVKKRGANIVNISSSTSEIWQNGKKIVVKTVNGKTTVKVNGKEYVPKGEK